jgi:PAS domain S-box-containing protein
MELEPRTKPPPSTTFDHPIMCSAVAREPLRDAQRFQVLARESADFFWITTPEGFLLEGSACWHAYTGHGAEAYGTASWQNILHPEDRSRFATARSRAEVSEDRCETMCRLRRADGMYCPFLVRSLSVRDSAGVPQEWLHLGRNLMSCEQGETNLKVPEEWYRAMVQTATEGIWLIDADAHTLYLNDRMATMLGVNPDEMIGRGVYEFVFPEERVEHVERIRHNIHGISEAFDARFRRKDGSEVLVLGSASPLPDSQGNIVGALGMFTDVTQRRRTEQALHRSEALYRTLMETVPQLVWSMIGDGVIIYANQRYQDYTGLTLAQLNTAGWRSVILPADLSQMEQRWRQGLATGEMFELELRLCRVDGSARWFQCRFTPVRDPEGQIVSWLATCTDIQKLKQAEIDLDEALGLLDTILDTAPVGFCLLDRSLRFLMINRRLAEMYGVSQQACTGKTLREVLPATEPIIARNFQVIEETGKPVLDVEVSGTTLHEPHVVRHWLSDFYPVYARQGILIGFGSMVLDITDRKRDEEALRQSDLRFRRLVESNVVGVVVADLSGTIYEANEVFLKMVGYSREEMLAGTLRWDALTPPRYQEMTVQAVQRVRATGVVGPYEKEYIRKDGSLVPVLISSVLFNQEQDLVLALALDISERKELERRKDEFLSLASHELRTPLTTTRGNLELAAQRLQRLQQRNEFSEEATARLNNVALLLRRALHSVDIQHRLINEFLDISRIQTNKLELAVRRCDLTRLVREVVENQRLLTPTRNLQLDVPSEPVSVVADADRIEQVINNYLTNAIKYSAEDQEVRVGLDVGEQVARVWVQDHGPGLPLEAQEHLWERFYQASGVTVQSGSLGGLGLGLYICRTLIKLHHGDVGVESVPGQGSTFWFTLPIAS